MQLNNIDTCFVTETWTHQGNEPEYQYIKANLNTAGYNILIQSRENRKVGGIAVIQKSHLHVKKFSSKNTHLLNHSNQSEHHNQIIPFHNHLQSTILNKATSNNDNLLRRISRPHLIIIQKL